MREKEKFVNSKDLEDEYICCSGSFQSIVDNIVSSGLLSRELAVESLNFLMENTDLLEKDREELSANLADDSVKNGESGFIVDSANFYVKLRKSTILLALMLVSSAAMSFVSSDMVALITPFLVGSVVGDVSHSGFRLYEESGEKCIIHELASKRPLVISPKDIKKNIGKRCARDYNCSFRKNGKCKCEIDDIMVICETLKDKGAVIKSGNYYGYII
ncbi:MAG: hypothetical protein NC489_45365 [Ruminococcus flavefaciens]|nr:hypothetical protein [Ruminococcus flavefaciens]